MAGNQHPWTTQLTPSREQYVRGEDSDRITEEHATRSATFSFNAGRNRSRPPNMLGQGECWELLNMHYPREAAVPQTRPGLVQFSGGTALGAIVASHIFQKDDTTSYIVVAAYKASIGGYALYYYDNNNAPVFIADLAASPSSSCLVVPTMLTFGNELLVAQAGEYLKKWTGTAGTANTGVKAHGHIVVTNYALIDISEGSNTTLTVGGTTFTFYAERSGYREITKGSNNNTTAANIKAAIDEDCWDVSATVDSATLTITATSSGAGGNSLPIVDGGDAAFTTYAADGSTPSTVLTGGVDGSQLDVISTANSPKGGIVATDQNRRVLIAGDTRTDKQDRLYFSGPGNCYVWNYGAYGSGEYIDIGFREGNDITAVVPFLDEVFVHKDGQDRQIYRIKTGWDPTSWSVTMRAFAQQTAALGPKCAVSVTDKHLSLDFQMFRSFSGTDTFDEIVSNLDGSKVSDIIGNPDSTGFLVVNPADMTVLVFPSAGTACAVYHYGSKRWANWKFKTASTFEINCAVYSSALNVMLLGGNDGKLYKLDSTVATDFGDAFTSRIVGPTLISDTGNKIVVTHAILDYTTIIEATGDIAITKNRDETDIGVLCSFVTPPFGTRLYDATGRFENGAGDDITDLLYSSPYGRKATMTQGDSEAVAPTIRINTGALAVNMLTFRTGLYGRVGK